LQLGAFPNDRGTLFLVGSDDSTDRGATVSGLYANGGGGVIGVNVGTTLTWNGQITSSANNGSFIKAGGGTLVLNNGTNNYAGGTYVEGGTLRLGVPGALPAAGPVNLL